MLFLDMEFVPFCLKEKHIEEKVFFKKSLYIYIHIITHTRTTHLNTTITMTI